TLSYARHREAFGRSQRNAPSRFLTEIPSDLTVTDDQTAFAGAGVEDFAAWFTGKGDSPASHGRAFREDDNDNPFDFSDAPEIEDGPADHLGGATKPPPIADPT